ncbi:39S ribosomal protein L23, mitochondrial [Hylaeus volcanicus]|uniref:39S ribosomal protein L23, mitochondrial n=1 Tax=Hylaeus volcanicus TaxID=313075 RepID=UPI0023B82B21|nr:39S ribosomal protein L23, mitochondrial [Hylaeus volcanicus]
MSTRWYPIYQKGNPQLRVFLPNFWLKLVKPEHKQQSNVVQFHCSMEMTKYDIRNYLEKIYNVHPVSVKTRIALGETRKCPRHRCVLKDDDIKIAYVHLPKGETFVYPDLFATVEKSAEDRLEETTKEFKQFVKPNTMPGLPTWFRT